MSTNITCDTTVIIRGLVPPRRKKKDETYKRQLKLHKKAKEILEKIEKKCYKLHIPLIAFIETAF